MNGKELEVIKKCGYEVEDKGNGAYSVLDEKGESINHKVLEGILEGAYSERMIHGSKYLKTYFQSLETRTEPC